MIPKIDSPLVKRGSELRADQPLTLEEARHLPLAQFASVVNQLREPGEPRETARTIGRAVRALGIPVRRGRFNLIDYTAAMTRRLEEGPKPPTDHVPH